MKKSSKSSLKKRSPNISLQHKNEASYKFSKKNFCTWPKKGLELKGLSGYLDVTRLVSRILGTWRCCGVMGIVSCVQGRPQTLVIIHHPLSEQGVGGFRGSYRPTCSAASTLSLWVLRGQRGAWALCILVYLVHRELCHLVQYTCPIVLPLISGF